MLAGWRGRGNLNLNDDCVVSKTRNRFAKGLERKTVGPPRRANTAADTPAVRGAAPLILCLT